jgi:hypothetical protein
VSLKNAIRAVQQELPISSRHERWLTENPNPVWSPEALEFARQQLSGEAGGARRGRKRLFRASAAGSCHRQQVFKILGVPGREEIDGRLANIFATGNFLHLKWQMQGLTEGWLAKAEVPIEREDLNAGGTMDGVLHNNAGFEAKTINSRGYGSVMTFGPKDAHIFQVDHYMHLTDITSFSIVYENKDTGEWREFRVDKDEERDARVGQSLATLNGYLADKTLPDVLPDCKAKEGLTYRGCAFRDICLKTKEWPA